MRKLVFLVMIVLLSQLAEAKTILYVTNASTDTPCSSLQVIDSLYCNRLTRLGYVVNVINELHARDNSTTWNEYVNNSDMIFLGNDSIAMTQNVSRDEFCGNVTSMGKPMFFTSVNTWISQPSVEGCAFYYGLVNFSFSNNKCSTKTFKIADSGFITEGFEPGENITIYSSPRTAKIYDTSNDGWITAECIPPNGSIDFYPVLFANSSEVFWGLDEPSNFSNSTWEIFDRTVLNLLNDTNWSIQAFSLPRVSTVNQENLIFARITQNGLPVTGTVNYTVGNLSASMNYDNFWKSNFSLSSVGTYDLNLTAYSYSLRGFTILPITVGDLIVNITSGDFAPDSNYTVSADISGAVSASYRILNLSSYDTLIEGNLSCESNVCTGTVSAMPNAASLLLEVTASGGSAGGSLKTINRETLVTDKDVYLPGDVISIDFFPNETLSQVNLTIIRPDGTKETPSPLQMDLISASHWNKRYSLAESSLNGTWIVDVKTKDAEYNNSVDVIAWKPFAYLNKNSFDAFDSLVLVVGTTQAYSNNLDIYVSANIIKPDNSNASLGYSDVKGNNIYNFSYQIPKNYPSGVSIVEINFSDSSNRSSTLRLNFSTNITIIGPSLFVTPSTISTTTIEGKLVEAAFTISNAANIKASSIITSVSGLDMTVDGPSSLEAVSSGDGRITISTVGLSEGTYTGTVNFDSLVGSANIAVSIEIIGDISAQASDKYSQLSSIESNITQLGKSLANTTDVLNLLNETKAILNKTIDDYNSGNYVQAKADFEEASSKFTQLESEVSNLHTNLPDYSYIIWYFALAVVIVIVTIAAIKLKGIKRKPKKADEKKEAPKQEQQKREEVYFEPKGGEYRTEYY